MLVRLGRVWACFLMLLAWPWLTAQAMPLSAGDRIHVLVESGEEFSGKYQIDVSGSIRLPFAGTVKLAGLESDVAAALISNQLVTSGLFKKAYARTTVQVLHWAPLDVRISGAVYYPGAHRVNLPPARERAPERQDELPGAGLPERRLSDALRAAGGVTLYADVSHVAVRRAGQTRLFNLWGLLHGEPSDDPDLISGDEVLIPTLQEPQSALARPSIITPPGVKIFVSNLIQPNNQGITVNAGSVPVVYGTRFSQAVVAANCVGGLATTSGARSAVMVRTDRLNGSTRTWESPVEDLIRNSNDQRNPVLIEGDAVACYDSGVSNIRDVFRAITDVITPFSMFRLK
jgi:polysaccharide biosynthesis/export protein